MCLEQCVYGLQKLGIFDVVAVTTTAVVIQRTSHRSGKIIAATDVKFDQDKVRGPKVMRAGVYTRI